MVTKKYFYVHIRPKRHLGRIRNWRAVDPDLRFFKVDIRKPALEEIAEVEVVAIHEIGVEDAGLVVGVDRLEAETLHALNHRRPESEIRRHGDEFATVKIINSKVDVSVGIKLYLRSRAGADAASAKTSCWGKKR